MISVKEALEIVSQNLLKFGKKEVNTLESQGFTCAESIYADRDFPPFDRVTMDGISINSEWFVKGQKEFEIEILHAAGDKRYALKNPGGAVEVMTGSILPDNTNVVIRYEDIEITGSEGNKVAKIMIDSAKPYKNVHRRGEDRKKGDLLIPEGTRITSAEIAVMATVGKEKVEVFEMPKTAIISTGDELVGIGDIPEEHQIRQSNVYAILNELQEMKVEAELFHIRDNRDQLQTKLKEIMDGYPLLILSGGVSRGKLDFVPEILTELGVMKHFHRVRQRPGKPIWFGTSENNVVFALPGNPVSTYMCFIVYVRSWLLKCTGLTTGKEYAILDADVSFTPNLTYFLTVQTYFDKDGLLMARPKIGHGSGDLANLLEADAFMELPQGQTLFNKGTSFPIHTFRSHKVVPYLES